MTCYSKWGFCGDHSLHKYAIWPQLASFKKSCPFVDQTLDQIIGTRPLICSIKAKCILHGSFIIIINYLAFVLHNPCSCLLCIGMSHWQVHAILKDPSTRCSITSSLNWEQERWDLSSFERNSWSCFCITIAFKISLYCSVHLVYLFIQHIVASVLVLVWSLPHTIC
jgi:hypothetical protein